MCSGDAASYRVYVYMLYPLQRGRSTDSFFSFFLSSYWASDINFPSIYVFVGLYNLVYAATYRYIDVRIPVELCKDVGWDIYFVLQELDFLVYAEFDCFDCSLLVLLSSSVDFDTDVVGLQLFIPAHFVKPYGCCVVLQ